MRRVDVISNSTGEVLETYTGSFNYIQFILGRISDAYLICEVKRSELTYTVYVLD